MLRQPIVGALFLGSKKGANNEINNGITLNTNQNANIIVSTIIGYISGRDSFVQSLNAVIFASSLYYTII